MPRFTIGENSSSSSDSDDIDLRVPKRRRMPFPSRVLYRHGGSSNPPAAGPSGVRREGASTNTPASAATTAVATVAASASQADSDDSFISSASEGEDEELEIDELDESEEEEVTPRPAVTPRPLLVNNSSKNLVKTASKDVVPSGSGGRTSERGPAILADTDVLDCAICFEPFTSPVYQV